MALFSSQLLRQRETELIIAADHRLCCRMGSKQRRLAGTVSRHVGVIVEMVAAEIGEHQHVELHAIDTPLINADRRHFHRHRLRTRSDEVCQQRLQAHRIRRGVGTRRQRAGKAVAQSADQRTAATHCFQSLCQHLGDAGLAIGAGHADRQQLPRRLMEDGRSQRAGKRIQPSDAKAGHSQCARVETVAVFPDHRCRTASDRGSNVVSAITTLPLPGEKDLTAAQLARVSTHAPASETSCFKTGNKLGNGLHHIRCPRAGAGAGAGAEPASAG